MPRNPYAAFPTADLCDLHNAVAWLLMLAARHAALLPDSEWAMLSENLTWISARIDAELEARRVLSPERAP